MNIEQFEGHTDNWYVDWPMATDEGDVIIGAKSIGRFKRADAELIAAAPDLLAEVKRLREQLVILERDLIGLCEDNYVMQDVIKDYFKEMIE